MSKKDTQFKKGADAREKGRKGGEKSVEVRRRKADILGFIEKKLIEEGLDGTSRDEKIAETLVTLAEGGDMTAIKEVMDRVHGKVKDTLSVDQRGSMVMRFGWAARAGRPDKQIEEEREDS